MSIYDIDETDLHKMTDAEVIAIDRRIHKVHRHDLRNVANDHRLGKLLSVLNKVHVWVVDVLQRRGLRHEFGGPSLPKRRQKIQTDFGDFIRESRVVGLPAIRLTQKDADRLEKGDVSFLTIPWTSENKRILESARVTRAVILSGKRAIGSVQYLLPGRAVQTGDIPDAAARVSGDAPALNLVGVIYIPFVNPVGVSVARKDAVLPPNSFNVTDAPLEKRRSAVLAFIFNEQDEVLNIQRTKPPVVWSPPGGFVEGEDTFEQAAIKRVLKETGIEVSAAFATRDLDNDITAVVGRAATTVIKTDANARWVAPSDLGDLKPIAPERNFFAQSLKDLRAYEEAQAEMDDLMVSDMDVAKGSQAALLQPLIDKELISKASKVQTVIFDKENWDAPRARKWLRERDFTSEKKDENEDSMRFRQFPPGECAKDSFKTLTENLPKGIILVTCDVSEEKARHRRKKPGELYKLSHEGEHEHPHEPNGIHDHEGLPENTGNHGHIQTEDSPDHDRLVSGLRNLIIALGGHNHREGDPMEGAHVGTFGGGRHFHPAAQRLEVELPIDLLAELHEKRPWFAEMNSGFVRAMIRERGNPLQPFGLWRVWNRFDSILHALHPLHMPVADPGEHAKLFGEGDSGQLIQKRYIFQDGTVRPPMNEDWEMEQKWLAEFAAAWKNNRSLEFLGEPFDRVPMADGEYIIVSEGGPLFLLRWRVQGRSRWLRMLGDLRVKPRVEAILGEATGPPPERDIIAFGRVDVYEDSENRIALELQDGEDRNRVIARRTTGDYYIVTGGKVTGLVEGSGHEEDEKDEEKTKKGAFKHEVPFIHHEVIKEGKEEKRLVYGIVYSPFKIDAQGDWANDTTIEKAAHRWLVESRNIKIMHKFNTNKVQVVESYVAPQDLRIGNRDVKKGAWVLVLRVLDDKIWKAVKNGEIRGLSLGGRSTVQEGVRPRV